MAKKPKRAAVEIDPDDTPPEAPSWMISGTKIKRANHEWDWQGRILRNSVNLIDGRKGLGKSSVMAAIASALCHGRKLPGETKSGPRGRVLWCGSEEENDKAILPRWLANGGKKETLETVDFKKFTETNRIVMPYDFKRFASILQAMNCRVLVVDPFDCLSAENADLCSGKPARAYMESFLNAAAMAKTTVLMARHITKSKSRDPLNDGLYSGQISATARVVLRVAEHPSADGSRVLMVLVGNYSGVVHPIIYKIEESTGKVFVCKWGKESSLLNDEILDGTGSEDDSDERLDASKLLLQLLKHGPVASSDINKEAQRALVSVASLRRAKKKLKITSIRKSSGNGGIGDWTWKLPEVLKPSK